MALLAKGTWIVLADGEKALICENTGTPRAPELHLHDRMTQDIAAQRDQADDKPGRMPDPGRNQRSAMEATDLPRLARERFAAEVAERIARHVGRAGVERLVIAAPPQTLAVLRAALDPEVRARVIAELPKALTHQPLPEVAGQLADLVDPL